MITCSFCGKSFFTYGEDYEDHLPTCFEMREEREQAKKENL
jgi:hypothetical protein